ncbi:MAG: GIY-YIG nuclease family protein [Dehalococcoidia bacterium]|nr:GIY-YIG nuclease family protein [Dehalococcoidia bacterium]
MDRSFFVYIMTNPRKTVLYTGVTNNLPRRVHEHKEKLTPGFVSKYNVTDLVYYEMAETAEAAIAREKQLKAGSRQSKLGLIKSMNPTWRDLSVDL